MIVFIVQTLYDKSGGILGRAIPTGQVAPCCCSGSGLVRDLELGYRQLLGDDLYLRFPALESILDPTRIWIAHGVGRSWFVGAGAASPGRPCASANPPKMNNG